METRQGAEESILVTLLETKYRDIADGNYVALSVRILFTLLETKYRDIADGNYAVCVS